MTIEVFDRIEALPWDARALLRAGARRSPFLSAAWFANVASHAMPEGAAPRYLLCRVDGRATALWPMVQSADGRGLDSMTTPYTCLYAPLLRPGAEARDLASAQLAFGRFCRAWPTVRIDALAADPLPGEAAFRRAGLAPLAFAHFGNWRAEVAGQDWDAFLGARPGALRTTIRRRIASCAAGTTVEIATEAAAVERAIADYLAVYARSWKQPEPWPEFTPAMIRSWAAQGILRLAVMHAGPTPVAAQVWVVDHGTATLVKLAHDEAYRALSPGTVLTALSIRELLGSGRVERLDFGRGDDPYKQAWAPLREQRRGLLLVNPRRAAGVAALGRHALGRLRRRHA